ncbi:GIN domain-containing protein [Maribacter arcticus]|jgi:hypothetical protein|uniref:GIN domain-containing protein n=1 Tax=Maribacter arcticus TaxID=561365 RepID=UPI003002458B
MKKAWCIIVVLSFNYLFAQEDKTFNSYATLEGVKTIEIHNNLCVILYPTYFYGVQINGDRSLKDIIKWKFENSTLILYTVQENTLASNAEIILYVNDLKEIKLSDTASIDTNEKLVTDNFTMYSLGESYYNLLVDCQNFNLIIDGSSTGNISVEAKNVYIDAKGASNTSMKLKSNKVNVKQSDKSIVSLNGKTQSLSATVDNKAQLYAWALLAKDVYLFSSNSEDIQVFAEDRLKINGQGSGKIYVTGSPKQIDTINLNKKTKIFYRLQ